MAILRRGAFDAAAAELNVTPSAISQRIKALEERVGAALIDRGPPCVATPIGARIAKHAQDLELLENQLSQELDLDQPARSHARIAVNADSLATWFVPAMAKVDGLFFDLVVDDQDHSADWLRRGEVAAAVTSTATLPGCDAIALGSLRYLATASPAFMRRWMPDGPTQETLTQAPCLPFNQKDQLQRIWMEREFGQRLMPPGHILPSTQAFIDAAMAGLGWGMNPAALIGRRIKREKLVCLKPDAPLDVPLYWQVSRVLAGALAPLTQAVKSTAQEHLIAPNP
jgi:LysR family transcriptional regulator (chromosome initiation inhibitor)